MLIIEADQLQGLAIASQLAARPDAVIFAGARDPASAVELKTLADAHPGRVHVLQVISADRANNNAAVEEIRKLAGRLDVIIANAGISDCFQNALEVPQAEMTRHFEVNTNGPLVLFQAAYDLLRASPSPKFVVISSGSGSIEIGSQMPVNIYAYGASKAAVNWVARKLHRDFTDLQSFFQSTRAWPTPTWRSRRS